MKLTILATNDLHGQLEVIEQMSAERPARTYRVGGAEALAATLADLRADNPEGTLLLDAGDFMQGTLLSNTFEGAPIRELYTQLGYDAAVVGNHEFDFGPEGPVTFSADSPLDAVGALKRWISEVPFPVLAANLLTRDGAHPPWKNLHSSVQLTRKGIRIGIVGVLTPEVTVTTMPAYLRDMQIAGLLSTVEQEAKALRRSGAQVVILLAHCVGACSRHHPAGPCRGELFEDVLEHLGPGLVDAVVAGHAHTCIWRRYRGIPVVEACSNGVAISRVELRVKPGRAGAVASQLYPPEPVCHDVFTENGGCEGGLLHGTPRGRIELSPRLVRHQKLVSRVRAIVARYHMRLPGMRTEVLAEAARPIQRERFGASSLGMLFTEAMLSAVPKADGALFNPGGMRDDLPAGKITYAQLYRTLPFENCLATVDLTGTQLFDLIRAIMVRCHGVVQVAGIRLRARCGSPPTLVSVSDRNGQPLRPDQVYHLVLPDFLLTGGDGGGRVLSRVPPQNKHIYADRLVRDVIAQYLRSMDKPVNSVEEPLVPSQQPQIVLEGEPCSDPVPVQTHLCR